MSAIIVFFFNDTATTEIYTLSLHDALPISLLGATPIPRVNVAIASRYCRTPDCATPSAMILSTLRSEEHTSELQSRLHLVCRLLLEKKNVALSNVDEIIALITQSHTPPERN